MTTAVTIGNFDGAHLGHVALVAAARRCAGENGRVVAMVFDPHPATVLRPEAPVPRLSTLQQRSAWLEAAGADEVVRLVPDNDLLSLQPRQFVEWLVARHRPGAIVEGPDFRFGRRRAGTVETLGELGAEMGFEAVIVDPVEAALEDCTVVRVGSTLIRWLLRHGRVRDAARLLGRPFTMQAPVVMGDRRGRSIGVPTANLDHGEYLLPADGIYAGRALRPDGAAFPAAISVGTKPTFGHHPRVCEAHLVGYQGAGGALDDYGWTITLEFDDWLRDQITYTSTEALVEQLHRDIANAETPKSRHQ